MITSATKMASTLTRQKCLNRFWQSMLSQESGMNTELSPSKFHSFAAIDHSFAYEQAMNGRHGRQLQLAELDASGKDDPFFDPFTEFEIGRSRVFQDAEYREKATDDDHDAGSSDDETGVVVVNRYGQDDDWKRFRNDGSLPYRKSQLAKFQAGSPAGGHFCIVELVGTQHKVTVDDVIVSNLIKPIESFRIGSVHTFKDNVLLVGSTHKTLVGMPIVVGAEVDVMVEEITQDAKVVVFKKRRKKNSQRRNGFRRNVTMLRVLDIRMPEGYDHHKCVPRVLPLT